MPEPTRMVPLYIARVADLRMGQSVSATCRNCGHVAEVAVVWIGERLPKDAFVKHLGPQFRCQECGRKGAEVDARRALGFYCRRTLIVRYYPRPLRATSTNSR